MDHGAMESMPRITLGVIPLTAFMASGVSPKVMPEISQIVKSVIRCAIRVSTMRNHRKVRSLSMSQTENRSRKKSKRIFSLISLISWERIETEP
eukprot:771731-Amphidinium_carterae.1